MTDNQTRPIGEQIRFLSSRTGAWVLDTYLEAAELGGRTIADLLADLFDGNGDLILSGLSNWLGFWQTGQQYRPGDTFKNADETTAYVTIKEHFSTTIPADLAAGNIDEVMVSVVGPTGPVGPMGPAGAPGAPGQTVKVIGAFGQVKTPTDLPPSGLIPVNWDGTGRPAVAHQFVVGEGMVYTPASTSDPKYNHIYSFASTAILAAGWVDVGAATGPQGLQGPPGGSYVVVAHLNTAPPDVNHPPIVPPTGLLVIDLDDTSHGQASLPAGGTTGQRLTKASNADYDSVWASDLFPDAPSDGKTYGRKSATWSEALPITGGTLTGNLTAPAVLINGAAGVSRAVYFETAGSMRWAIYARSGTEPGSNVGSDLAIERHADSGSFIDMPVIISRQYGGMTLNVAADTNPLNFPQINGAAGIFRLLLFRTGGLSRFSQGISSTAEGGGNAGSDYVINRYNDAGAAIDQPFGITRSNGQVVVSSTAGLRVTGAAGTVRQVLGTTGNLTRWVATFGNATAESGSNAGSDFNISRYDDAGNLIDTPFTINRAAGAVALGNSLSINNAAAGVSLLLNGATGTNRQFMGATGGSSRWLMLMGNATPESGGNAGSDFYMYRYTDAGAIIDAPLTISRATGAVGMTNTLSIVNASAGAALALSSAAATNRQILGMTGGSLRWMIALGNTTPETGSNNGSDFSVNRYSDAGAFIDTPFSIGRTSGQINTSGAIVSAGGHLAPFFVINGSAGVAKQVVGQTASVNRWLLNLGDGSAETGSDAGSNMNLTAQHDAGTSIGVVFSAVRATRIVTFTNAIVNGPSDRTLKENIEPLTGSLDRVLELQGVSFNMIGDDPARRQIGLIAQDVAPVVPEVIQQFQTYDAEGKAADIKMAIDYPKLVAVLIEAIKELTARVAVLEAKS